MADWNGKINSLSISSDSCPELYDELSRTSHRERSARLRTLALIGLFALRQQGQGIVAGAAPIIAATQTSTQPSDVVSEPEPAKEHKSPRLTKAQSRLADKLMSST